MSSSDNGPFPTDQYWADRELEFRASVARGFEDAVINDWLDLLERLRALERFAIAVLGEEEAPND